MLVMNCIFNNCATDSEDYADSIGAIRVIRGYN